MDSQTAEHALRAVLYVARRGDGRPISAERVARALGAPRNYLSKTLNALARRGILRSTPGRKGGFSLAVPPDQLTLVRVLEAFDCRRPEGDCLLEDRTCRVEDPCGAHVRWKRIESERRAPLVGNTVADLLAGAGAN
ncbi:MAG TPA: Rrf2 family transcriptional regulator [Longimicrobiales bacterium]|jgi:Rrf2 family protein